MHSFAKFLSETVADAGAYTGCDSLGRVEGSYVEIQRLDTRFGRGHTYPHTLIELAERPKRMQI